MSHPIGTRVRVTDERTTIGGASGDGKPSPYVGATGVVTSVSGEDSQYVGPIYRVEFDDAALEEGNSGTWTHAALDAVYEAPARPVIDFSGSSRQTARAYARNHVSRVNKAETNALLKAVAAGQQVDAYALNEALLDAMRGAATRAGQSPLRRIHGREIAYLGHIVQAVLESHADGLPAYAEGDRSRAVEAMKEAVREAKAEIDLLTANLNDCRSLADRKISEVEELTAEVADQREVSRLHESVAADAIDDLNHARAARTAEKVQAYQTQRALDYALSLLDDEGKARVAGFRDGLVTS